MNAEKIQSILSEIENDFSIKCAETINQLFDVTSTVEVESIAESRLSDIQALVEETALLAQVDVLNKTYKLFVLADQTYLPSVAASLRENSEEESAEVTKLKETLSYIFSIFGTCLINITKSDDQFSLDSVQLWDFDKNDQRFQDGFSIIFNLKISEKKYRICKIIPKALVEKWFQQANGVGTEKVVAESSHFEQLEDRGSINMNRKLETLFDLDLPITVELGRVKMQLKDILDLGPGSIVELDKFSGEAVDILVNAKKFAEGEVIVIDQNFGVRITAMASQCERLASLGK